METFFVTKVSILFFRLSSLLLLNDGRHLEMKINAQRIKKEGFIVLLMHEARVFAQKLITQGAIPAKKGGAILFTGSIDHCAAGDYYILYLLDRFHC